MVGQKRSSYNAEFKLKVIHFAEQSNNSVAARHFTLNEKQVREWRKKKDEISKSPKLMKAARGHKPSFPALEEKLADWVQMSRQSGFNVTRKDIRIMALNMIEDPDLLPSKPTKFAASVGWCNRFMNRYGLCTGTRTEIAQESNFDYL